MYEIKKDGKLEYSIPNLIVFISDLASIVEQTHNSINKSFCNNRLEILDERFKMHLL